MKRSKVFLGITTGILAIVAFTAAKAHKFSATRAGYLTSTNNKCTVAVGANWYTKVTAGHTAKTTFGRVIYSQNTSGGCVNKLYTVAD